ncbi:MAG: cytochrome P450 [Rhodospirillaceae bacterium]|jgi:cytochrome P450|nr:cytochrome P450 [Rhodospirillaceae bacterium]MBT5667801.1 cytochrome P450 [Rhodospirillaceae bacterium]MBT5810553.1 cytochrome P450 [Rhodospirillaceae bacterium]
MSVLYDPRDPANVADPFPILGRLRDEDPVHHSDILGGWVLTRHGDVRDALKDTQLSADRITPFLNHLPPEERESIANLGGMLQRWVVFMDPPRHTQVRALMNRAFTSNALAALEPKIDAIVNGLIDDMLDKDGDADFIADFAYPLPATVIAIIIGVPPEDIDRIKAWSDDLATFVGSALETPDKRDRAESSVRAMTAYFKDIIAYRRKHPPEESTIIDNLIAAEEHGAVLDEATLVASCVLLLFAGHETTTNLFGNGLLAMLRNPDQLTQFQADPAMTNSAVEEFLRYDGPIGAMPRVTTEPYTIGDVTLPPGERVFCMVNAANRDPAVFRDPDRLNLKRPANRHIVFGFGIHFCIGAPLARLEGRIGFPALLRRLADIEQTGDVTWNDSMVLRGLQRLPIGFANRL